jgi:uncharacterized protein YchJ
MRRNIVPIFVIFVLIASLFICGCSLMFDNSSEEKAQPATADGLAEEIINPNLVGNTAGNISNLGLAAGQDDWIYYVNDTDGYSIYKIRTDGSGRTKLNDDNSRYINVVGQWIYYVSYEGQGFIEPSNDYPMPVSGIPDNSRSYNIYRMRIDGSNREKLNSDNSRFLKVIEDWIYYNNQSDGGSLCRIRTDGSDRSKLNSGESLYINIDGDWIYYMKWGESCDIFRIRPDGSDENLVMAQTWTADDGYRVNVVPWFLQVEGNWLYFTEMSSGRWIMRVSTDLNHGERFDDSSESYYLNLHENWVYYISREDGGMIYRSRSDGSGKTPINTDKSWMINLVGEWIYYSNRDDNDKLYRIRSDGSGREEVQ